MAQFLSSLCFGLLLVGATNCQDKNSEPAPQLEGSWTSESLTIYDYDRADKLIRTAGPAKSPVAYKIDILPDSVITYSATSGTFHRVYALSYRKQGDVLVYLNGNSAKIKELTAHTLVLLQEGAFSFSGGLSGRRDTETKYSR
jgi:hypothetical protein